MLTQTQIESGVASAPRAGNDGRRRAYTVWLLVLCMFAHGLTFTAVPLLLPLIRSALDMSFTDAGMLTAAATLSYALGQIPAGLLADRFGPRRPFFAGLLGWSALTLAFACLNSLWIAVVCLFVAGAFRALMFAPGLSLLASWYPPERRATAMSLYMVGGFGGQIALALIAPLIAAAYGWRIALVVLALPGVIGAFAFRALAADAPRRKTASPLAWADVIRVASSPVMWLCCALQFARFTVVIAFIVWLPSLLVADHGFSVQSAGLIVGAGAALTAASNFVGGYVSDHLRNPPLVIGGTFAMLACACWMLGTVQSLPLLYVAIALAAIFLQFYFGAIFLVPVEALGPRLAGTATGAGNLFANIGGFLTAYAFGAIKDYAGSFGLGYRAVAIICVAGVVLSYVLARVRTRALAHTGAATH